MCFLGVVLEVRVIIVHVCLGGWGFSLDRANRDHPQTTQHVAGAKRTSRGQPANVAHIHTHRQRRNDTRRDQLKTTLSVPVSTSPSEISSKPRKTIQAKLDKPRPAKSRQNALGGAIHGGGGGTQGAGFSGRLLLTWHCNRTMCLGAT